MEEPQDIAARQAAELAELAAQGMEMARAYAAAVKEAMELGDWHHGLKLGQAHARTARCVRLTHILEAKLAREAKLGVEEDRKLAEKARQRDVDHRKADVRACIERELREADPDEFAGLEAALYGTMIREARDPAFLSEDIDTLIARIRRDLGLLQPEPAPPGEGAAAPPSAHPREGGRSSGDSAATPESSPDPAWVPARAGTSGDGVRIFNSS